jgi:hypothetical protein
MAAEDNINPVQFPGFDPDTANYHKTAYDYEGAHNNLTFSARMQNAVNKENASDHSFLSRHDPAWRENTLNEVKQGSLGGKFTPNKSYSAN